MSPRELWLPGAGIEGILETSLPPSTYVASPELPAHPHPLCVLIVCSVYMY